MEKIWLKSYPPGVPHDVNPEQYRSVAHLLEESFRKHAKSPFSVCMDRWMNYGELERLSGALGAYLQGLGLQPGARVAIMLPNIPQFGVTMAAVLRAGYTCVNVNPLYTARELGATTKDHWSIGTMFEMACAQFAEQGRPLVVDEADRIAEKNTIEALRDLHDIGQVPILLVGEEHLKRKLASKHERFHDRVLVWARAMPASDGDLTKLINHYTPGLQIAPEARQALLTRTGGVARRVVTTLHALSELRKTRAIELITVDDLVGVI